MKIPPYVYKLTHRETNQFYIGYRMANTKPSNEDLGIEYFTSSKIIEEMGFDNFDICIIAEFINPDRKEAGIDAYCFEQRDIKYNFNDPLCINDHYIDVDSELSTGHFRLTKHSQAAKDKIGNSKRGKPRDKEMMARLHATRKGVKASDETRQKMRDTRNTPEAKKASSDRQKGKKRSAETNEKIIKSLTGRKKSPETCKKLSEGRLGKKHTPEAMKKMKDHPKSEIHKQRLKDAWVIRRAREAEQKALNKLLASN